MKYAKEKTKTNIFVASLFLLPNACLNDCVQAVAQRSKTGTGAIVPIRKKRAFRRCQHHAYLIVKSGLPLPAVSPCSDTWSNLYVTTR